MATESLQFNFVGNWDFKKIEAINKNPSVQKSVPTHGSKEYIPFLWQIAGGAPRYSEILSPVLEKGKAIMFENNVLIDRDSMICNLNSKKFGKGIPQSLIYADNGNFVEFVHSCFPLLFQWVSPGM